jgi:hypothetical protein
MLWRGPVRGNVTRWGQLRSRGKHPERHRDVALVPRRRHTGNVLTALLIAISFAAPWIGAIALICWRAGARLLWSEADQVFPTQANQWRGVSAR